MATKYIFPVPVLPLGLWAWDNYYIEPFFNGTFWVESGKTTGRLTVRTVKGVGQAGLIGSDMIGYGASSAFGWGDEYQGNSQLFQMLYADPTALGSAGEVRGNILKGSVKEVVNVGTMGGYKMAESFGEGLATGDFEAAQDRALQGLLLSTAAKSMQARGVNPYKTYSPGQYSHAVEQFAIRQRVLANIAESQRARAASEIETYLAKDSALRTPQQNMVDTAVREFIPKVQLPGHPIYDPTIPASDMAQITWPIGGPRIGPSAIQYGYEGVVWSILHETLHARWNIRGVPGPHDEAAINSIVARYFEMRGWR